MFGLLKKIVTLPIDVTETVVTSTAKTTRKVVNKTSDAIGLDDLIEEIDRIFDVDVDDDDD